MEERTPGPVERGIDGFTLRCSSAPPPSSSSSAPSSFTSHRSGGPECFSLHSTTRGTDFSCNSIPTFKTEDTRDRAVAGGGRRASAAGKKLGRDQRAGFPVSPLKARKENLGQRISALQQLVSPYGKSDAASVLHEAVGYIKFLHDQVQVLSAPFLHRLPPSHPLTGDEEAKWWNCGLRSRGLCLVPIACTAGVAGSNGADFWSPAKETSSVNPPPGISDQL